MSFYLWVSQCVSYKSARSRLSYLRGGMDLKCRGAPSALHREEPAQDQRRCVNVLQVRHCHLLWLPLERSHTDTPCLSLASKVRVAQLNPEMRSVINASDSHLLFYYWENDYLNLLSDHTDGARRNIFFSHVRKPGVIEHPHSGERWDNKLLWNTDCSWVFCEILASWKQTKNSRE